VSILWDRLSLRDSRKMPGRWYINSNGRCACNPATRSIAIDPGMDYAGEGQDAARCFHEVAHVVAYIPGYGIAAEELFLLQFEGEAATKFGLNRAAFLAFRSLTTLLTYGGVTWSDLVVNPEAQGWWTEGYARARRLRLLPIGRSLVADVTGLTALDETLLTRYTA